MGGGEGGGFLEAVEEEDLVGGGDDDYAGGGGGDGHFADGFGGDEVRAWFACWVGCGHYWGGGVEWA